jgi:NAD(P)-dependent dehydrogenase (short-subunit alcohol dehydrogenase family)
MTSRHWGRIINIASINSKMPSLHAAAYTASKHGVVGLTKALALETAAQGITVNAICPGPVHTLMNDKRLEYDAQRRGTTVAEIEKTITPIGGRLEPADIAPLAVYLASDEARTVTGQAWNIDGGICMAG